MLESFLARKNLSCENDWIFLKLVSSLLLDVLDKLYM
jgi:hypothetical protein